MTVQSLMQKKLIGNYLSGARPFRYKRREWEQATAGRGRAVALLIRALLGVPSYHGGDSDHPSWAYQFADGGVLIVSFRQAHAVDFHVRGEETQMVKDAYESLLVEVSAKLKEL